MSKASQRGGAGANQRPRPQARRSFSDRARRAALLHTQGHSRKQIAELIGVAPETISVWKRHPQWQREVDRWRDLAETPLDATQMRLKLESLEAMTTALEQLQLLMGATKPVRTGGRISEQPDWQTRLKACRLALAITFAVIPEFQDQYRRSPHPTRRPLTAAPAKRTLRARVTECEHHAWPAQRQNSVVETTSPPSGRNRIQQM